MKTTLAAVLLVLALTARASAQDESSGILVDDRPDYNAKWALVVGINYANSKSGLKLDNAERDASTIGRMLNESYGFHCDVLLGDQATRRAIEVKLQEYERTVEDSDCFLFYFAGHGVTDDEMPYLYPADVESEDGTISGRLAPFEILRTRIKARHSLYVFDSCYSGEILNLRQIPPLNRTRDVQGNLVFEGRSLQILTSSANNQKAADGREDHSPFASSFMASLRELHRSESTDVVATTSLAARIPSKLEGQQPQFLHLNPELGASHSGDFLFLKTARAMTNAEHRFVFQTLPGTPASLPGSPLDRTWFDEMPWLTPQMRLIMDNREHVLVSSILGGTSETGFVDSRKLTVTELNNVVTMMSVKADGVDHELKAITDALLAIQETADRQESLDQLMARISRRSRSDQSPSVQSHLLALMASTTQGRNQSAAQMTVEQLFDEALAGYHPELQRGLRARCYADYANWQLRQKNYQAAKDLFEKAWSMIDAIEAEGVSAFRIELLAGTALASRHLAKNSSSPRQAAALWRAAGAKYQQAFSILDRDQDGVPNTRLVRAFLHSRAAWLAMDLWEVAEAMEHFKQALSLNEPAADGGDLQNLDAFLKYCHASQGLAMAKRLQEPEGLQEKAEGKQELEQLRDLLRERIERIERSGAEPPDAIVERLWNTTERLGDSDFLSGRRETMAQALTIYNDRGLQEVRRWQRHVRSEQAETQQLRFCCKVVIAAAIVGDDRRLRHAKSLLNTAMDGDHRRGGFITLLHDVALAFSEYHELKYESTGSGAAQRKLDELRLLIQSNVSAGLDREITEFLMMLSGVLSDEQRQLDARVLQVALPKGADGLPPRGSVRYVREQYDRIINLHVGSNGALVHGGPEFMKFVDLVQSARQSPVVNHERPFAIFYFPLSGGRGMLVIQRGQDSNSGSVYLLSFGSGDVSSLSPEKITEVNKILNSLDADARLYWSDDALLTLPEEHPFGKSDGS